MTESGRGEGKPGKAQFIVNCKVKKNATQKTGKRVFITLKGGFESIF